MRRASSPVVATLAAVARKPPKPKPIERAGPREIRQTQRAAKRKAQDEKRNAVIEEWNDEKKCKPRPTDNRGDGGSRAFVPWCERRR